MFVRARPAPPEPLASLDHATIHRVLRTVSSSCPAMMPLAGRRHYYGKSDTGGQPLQSGYMPTDRMNTLTCRRTLLAELSSVPARDLSWSVCTIRAPHGIDIIASCALGNGFGGPRCGGPPTVDACNDRGTKPKYF